MTESSQPLADSDTWNTPAPLLALVRGVMGGSEPGRLVPLTHGLFAVVDEQDFERVNARGWFACPVGTGRIYARSSSANPRVYMHRYVLVAPQGMSVDHPETPGRHQRREEALRGQGGRRCGIHEGVEDIPRSRRMVDQRRRSPRLS